MLLYYITDRSQFAGGEEERQRQLLERIARAAAAGIDLVQLREKDLPARDVAQLATAALRDIHIRGASTRLLINSRIDVALACGAHGVHLTSTDPGPELARNVLRLAGGGQVKNDFLIAVSCHSMADVRSAAGQGANLVVFAPIFEKVLTPREPGGVTAQRQSGIGCKMLHQACSTTDKPVLALGGVTLDNAADCMRAGAAGIAGIRLFQESNMEETVRRLRTL